MLFSLFSTPSATLNMDDEDMTAAFVREHAVRGFTGGHPTDRAGHHEDDEHSADRARQREPHVPGGAVTAAADELRQRPRATSPISTALRA